MHMRSKTIGLVVVVTLGLLALACTTKTTTTVLPSDQERPGIAVSGSGSAFGEPDVAVVSLGVEVEAQSVTEARDRAAEAMNAMLDALKDGGVAEEDLRTTRFSVQPQYDFFDGRREFRGFAVDNTVTVKIRTIDDTGELIDAALTAGGDLARVDSLRFTIDDPSALEDEARREAMANARDKAETLAEVAEVELGPPSSISEVARPISIRLEAAAYAAADEFVGTPIELGELEVRVDVQVVYGLE
jgi:hypothetical protein